MSFTSKLITSVFKIFAFSIILMLVFDTTVMLIDATTTTSKIMTIVDFMEYDISRHNELTPEACEMFGKMLDNEDKNNLGILQRSKVFDKKQGVDVIGDKDILEVANYGDMKHLVITVNVSPWIYSIQSEKMSKMLGKVVTPYTLTFVRDIPCLRYIK